LPDVHFRTDSDELPGYLSTPAASEPAPGVVVIMDALGMTADLRNITDRIAAHGYVALAPDLYGRGGRLRCTAATIRASRQGVGPAYADIDAARRFLAGRSDCTGRVGIIGFCMGGGFALLCGLSGDYGASSVNYGFVPDDIDARLDAGDMCPVVGSYGKADRILPGHRARLVAALTKADVVHDIKEYDGVGHSFLNRFKVGPLGPLLRVAEFHYDAEVAADAWHRIFAFFDEHLR
jgi:carboxymethylenebutenolidase